MLRKIRGYPFKVKPAEPTETESNVAASAGSGRKRSNADFANTVAYFEKLLQTLSTEPAYEPINPELQLAALKERLEALQSANAAVVTAAAEWGKARRERNSFLYQGRGSLHSTAMAVKQQVKATFGSRSPETSAAAKVRFTKKYDR
jgi:hypothetical protein